MPQSDTNTAHYRRMTEQSIPKLIGTLAVPTIISMMITSIYNTADTAFVSQLGTSATGAVGIVLPIMTFFQAVGLLFGNGSGINISQALGKKDMDTANRMISTSFFTSLGVGALITVLGLIFLDPLMKLLGATPTILPYAREYARYILLGAPIMCTSFVMNNSLRAEGNAKFAMVGIAFGGVLNIALDPLFIFVFDMGIGGAAIATLISQSISFLILLSAYLMGRSQTRIALRHFSAKWKTYSRILSLGLASLLRHTMSSVATIALNLAAGPYGDAAIAAMSVVGRLNMFILSAILGFGQGFQPVAGFNYGAKKYSRVKEGFWFCTKAGTAGLLVLSALGFVFAPQIMGWFRPDDAVVIAIGTAAFRFCCVAMPTQALITISTMMFQFIGYAKQANLVSMSRQGLCFLPLIIILPYYFGVFGIQIAQPLADVMTFLICIPLCVRIFKVLNRQIEEEEKAASDEPA